MESKRVNASFYYFYYLFKTKLKYQRIFAYVFFFKKNFKPTPLKCYCYSTHQKSNPECITYNMLPLPLE